MTVCIDGSCHDNQRSSAEPITSDYQNYREPSWVASARKVLVSEPEIIRYTYTREERKNFGFAYNTCSLCPRPHIALEVPVMEPRWSRPTKHCGGMFVMTPVENRWGETLYRRINTVRCTECNRLSKRYTRLKKRVERLVNASEHAGKRIAFVTLTFPNWENKGESLYDKVRWFKKKVAEFSEKAHTGLDRVVGGFNCYEWTNPDHGIYNIHSHSLWIMDYWPQKDLQKAWEEHMGLDLAIVHIKRMGDAYYSKKKKCWIKPTTEADCLFYATKYAAKENVKGIRLTEGFGTCRGREYALVVQELQAQREMELLDVVDVVDCKEN